MNMKKVLTKIAHQLKEIFLRAKGLFSAQSLRKKMQEPEAIAAIFITAGILFRLKHYLTNCSLWTDEAWVAVSVTSRSLWDIVRGVEIFPDFSKPPLGFLVLTKTATLVFGTQEYALRLFAFIFGIAAIFLFYRLLKRFQDKALTVLALGFFCLSPSLIYYSAELKQYSLDLALGLMLFLFFGRVAQEPLRFKESCLIGLVGAVAMWISNAVLFILAAFGFTIFFLSVFRKRWRCLACAFLIYGCWAVSFWFLYQRVLANMVTNNLLFQMWKGALLESPLFSLDAVKWIQRVLSEMFIDPLNFSVAAIAFPLFILGAVSFARKHKAYALLFLFSILVTLLAAIFHKYPFRGRLLLFLFPGVLVCVVEGVLWLARSVRKEFSLAVIVVLLLCLCNQAFFAMSHGFAKDYCRENTREAVQFVSQQYKQGDFIFLNSAAQFPLWYYGARSNIARHFTIEWAGMENGVPKQGVKIAKFWEGYRLLKDKRFTFFRYEFNLYNKFGQYMKSLVRAEMTGDDVFFIFEGVPLTYPVPGERVWVLLAGASPRFENIVISAFDLRFLKIAEFRTKGMIAYLYRVR
jgi:hypothetical protein